MRCIAARLMSVARCCCRTVSNYCGQRPYGLIFTLQLVFTLQLFSPPPTPLAGTLGVGVARDKLLSSLCEFTLMDPPEEGQPGLSAQEGLLVTR